VSRVLLPARHIISHFGDESIQAFTCTGTDNTKQTTKNKQQKIHQKAQNKQTGQRYVKHKHAENPYLNLNH